MEIYEAIAPRDLTAVVRTLPEPPNYTLNSVLPDVMSTSIDFELNQITETNRAAHFRSYDAPVEIGRGPSLVRTEGEMPALGEGYLIGEYRRLLEQSLIGANITDALFGSALGYARRGFGAIRARMEVARGQVLSTGKFTLGGEGGLVVEADFGVPAANFVAPAILWSDLAASTVVANLQAWVELAETAGGFRPDTMVLGRTAASNLLQNEKIRNLYGNAFGSPQQLSGGQVNQVLDALDLPSIALDGEGRPVRSTRVNVDGATVDTFPADRVALFAAGQIGRTLWGPTFEALELAARGELAASETPGLIALVYRDGNPGKLFTAVNATGIPVLDNPKALVVADVV